MGRTQEVEREGDRRRGHRRTWREREIGDGKKGRQEEGGEGETRVWEWRDRRKGD